MLGQDVCADTETLDCWLENLRAFIPKTRMTFSGVKDADTRGDLIALLKAIGTEKMSTDSAMLSALVVVAQDDAAAVGDAFMQTHHKMMADMGMEPTGDADKDFVRMMIPHHRGAIDMAEVELKYGKDEKLRAMAEEIIAAQNKEIAEMESWQKANP